MVNVYVYIDVHGLPVGLVDDSGFLPALWSELPDASVAGDGTVLSITLSQLALSTDRAARRQRARVKKALAAIGYPDARVSVEETSREGWRDDLSVIHGFGCWHMGRLVRGVRARP